MKVQCFTLVTSRALNFENASVNMFAQYSLRTLYYYDVSSCPILHLFYFPGLFRYLQARGTPIGFLIWPSVHPRQTFMVFYDIPSFKASSHIVLV